MTRDITEIASESCSNTESQPDAGALSNCKALLDAILSPTLQLCSGINSCDKCVSCVRKDRAATSTLVLEGSSSCRYFSPRRMIHNRVTSPDNSATSIERKAKTNVIAFPNRQIV